MKASLEDKVKKAAEYIEDGDPYRDFMDNYDVMDAIVLLAKKLHGDGTMKIKLKQNKTDTSMIEMWTKVGNMPYLMAVVHVDNFTELVEHSDDLDGETVVEMKVIGNE